MMVHITLECWKLISTLHSTDFIWTRGPNGTNLSLAALKLMIFSKWLLIQLNWISLKSTAAERLPLKMILLGQQLRMNVLNIFKSKMSLKGFSSSHSETVANSYPIPAKHKSQNSVPFRIQKKFRIFLLITIYFYSNNFICKYGERMFQPGSALLSITTAHKPTLRTRMSSWWVFYAMNHPKCKCIVEYPFTALICVPFHKFRNKFGMVCCFMLGSVLFENYESI